MVEKAPISKSERRALRKRIKPDLDFADSRDNVGMVSTKIGGILRSYYDLTPDPKTGMLVEKIAGKSAPVAWETAYDDATTIFETLDAGGFTDAFAKWAHSSYSDQADSSHSIMINAACVGVAVVMKAFELQNGDDFMERFENAAFSRIKDVKELLDRNELNPRDAQTPISHGRRGRLPTNQVELGIIVNAISRQAAYPTCVMDGAIIAYRVAGLLWDDIVAPEQQDLDVELNADPIMQGTHHTVTLEDQARVDVDAQQQ